MRNLTGIAIAVLCALSFGCATPNAASRCERAKWRSLSAVETLGSTKESRQFYTTDFVPADSCRLAESGYELVYFHMLPKTLSEAQARSEACLEAENRAADLVLLQKRVPLSDSTGTVSKGAQILCNVVRIPGAEQTDDFLSTYWVRKGDGR